MNFIAGFFALLFFLNIVSGVTLVIKEKEEYLDFVAGDRLTIVQENKDKSLTITVKSFSANSVTFDVTDSKGVVLCRAFIPPCILKVREQNDALNKILGVKIKLVMLGRLIDIENKFSSKTFGTFLLAPNVIPKETSKCKTLIKNGNSLEKIDIVFLASIDKKSRNPRKDDDWYRPAEEKAFTKDLLALFNNFLRNKLFEENKASKTLHAFEKKFNLHYIFDSQLGSEVKKLLYTYYRQQHEVNKKTSRLARMQCPFADFFVYLPYPLPYEDVPSLGRTLPDRNIVLGAWSRSGSALNTFTHEVGHALFDLQHTGYLDIGPRFYHTTYSSKEVCERNAARLKTGKIKGKYCEKKARKTQLLPKLGKGLKPGGIS